MKKLLILFLFINICAYAQIENFFKYSTFYTSASVSSPFVERDNYIAVDKGYEDITTIHPYDYNLTIGIRKIARFDYEYKVKTWYYGTEKAVTDNVTIGNAVGWEYLANYSFIRNRGDKFTDQNYWVRYLGNRFLVKAEYNNDQKVKLKYSSTDFRYRLAKGNWDLTAGVVFRMHPVYGVNPIEDFWIPGEQSFKQLAESFGYNTEFVNGDWHWFSDGELIATSDDEFYKHYFGDAVASFNERELDKLGEQKEISLVLGAAYYKYSNDFWLHAWANFLPYHYGVDEYSFEYTQEDLNWLEWDAGVVFGLRINKHFGIFVEGTHMKYWDKPIYECKFGFNYLIF